MNALDYELTFEQYLERENARVAAMAWSMAALSLDEQYVMGRVLHAFLAAKQAGENLNLEFEFSAEAFSKRCLVAPTVAIERLRIAGERLTKRIYRYTHAIRTGRGRAHLSHCWFDALRHGAESISLTMSHDTAIYLTLALDVVEPEVAESESMVSDLFTGLEFSSAILARPARQALPKGSEARPPARLIWGQPAVERGAQVE